MMTNVYKAQTVGRTKTKTAELTILLITSIIILSAEYNKKQYSYWEQRSQIMREKCCI